MSNPKHVQPCRIGPRSRSESELSKALYRRAAFTLVEVMVAVGLSLLLMIAALSAVGLYRDVSRVGRDLVEQAQLASAVVRTMERDIRSCELSGSDPDADEGGTTDGEEPSEEIAIATELDIAGVFTATNLGVVGDATTLVVHARHPMRHTGWLPNGIVAETDTSHSERRAIAYFIAGSGNGGFADSAGDILAAAGHEIPGLARLDGDRSSLAFADATYDIEGLMEHVRLLAGEVKELRFRYFDGLVWHDDWDSTALARLPNAIEITFGMRPLSFSSTARGAAQESAELRLYRHVVALPTTVPDVAYQETSSR
jgi:type II secretory pathway pseudopilin PulG